MVVTHGRAPARRFAALALAAALPLLAGCTRHDYPQSTFQPRSEFASWVAGLNVMLIVWVIVIFALVQTLLLVAIVRFRARPGAPPPKPVHGHTLLEIAWTIAPAIVLALVAIPTVLIIFRTQGAPPRTDVHVKVVGHQWWWEYQYPELGVVTAGELHLPVGKTAVIDIESADVIHSFWFPAMGGKRDAVPNRTNRIWFTPDSLGEYFGQCVEFCGMSHANMRTRLFVETPEQFAAWVANQKLPPVGGTGAPDTAHAAVPAAAGGVATAQAATLPAGAGAPAGLAARGRQIFAQSACIGCHTIQGVSAGIVGPNLTHFASRTSFAGALYERTDDNVARWLQNPPERKPGSLMPNLGLTPDQITALVAYLQSLK
jgi:cytochrome c oxidase subunit II